MRPPFLNEERWQQLLINGQAKGRIADADLRPVVCLDNPDGIQRWLLASVDPNNLDRAMGLVDLGNGMPEMTDVSLAELTRFRGRKGSALEPDPSFFCEHALSKYTGWARMIGWILV